MQNLPHGVEISSDTLITTVIPTFRRPELLRRAIYSALNQSFRSLAVLVLDNASGDETAKVVAEIASEDGRVFYHAHASNIGAAANFRYGLENVKTPFFSLLSDDDVLLPNFYSHAMSEFESQPAASFVALGTLHFTPEGEFLGLPITKWPPGIYHPPQAMLDMIHYGHPEWTAMLFRREVLEKVGTLRDECAEVADFDFGLRCASRVSFVVGHARSAIFTTYATRAPYRFDTICRGWLWMIDQFAKSEYIAVELRDEVVRQLNANFESHLFLLGFRYLYYSQPEDAVKTAELLRQRYRQPVKAFVLKGAVLIAKSLGKKNAELLLNATRRCWRLRRRSSLSRTDQDLSQESVDFASDRQFLAMPKSTSRF